MKKLLIPFIVGVMALGASSCQKCAECDNCPFGISGDFCVDDYNSKDDYDAALANAKAAGCDCTEKLKGK
ncbi:MAG: hypothetical protein H6601_02490 [Flavobacteriales bacterium]|nr:hypothetical protein [Flavobacteriales bacterium]